MEGIKIVDTSIEHINDIMIIERLSFAIPWSKKSFVEEISNNKFAHYICAVTHNNTLGYAGMWKIFDEGHITNFAVHPEYRRAGIGSKMMDALIGKANVMGIKSMTLEVRENNKGAISLYTGYGFREVGIRKNYYVNNGENAIIMWKMDKIY